MRKIIDDGAAAASKMTRHDEADKQHAGFVKRWTGKARSDTTWGWMKIPTLISAKFASFVNISWIRFREDHKFSIINIVTDEVFPVLQEFSQIGI